MYIANQNLRTLWTETLPEILREIVQNGDLRERSFVLGMVPPNIEVFLQSL